MGKVNRINKNRKQGATYARFDLRSLLYLGNAIGNLKSDVEITIRSPSMGWGDNDIAIEVHCGPGGITTKKSTDSKIGIFGFLRGWIKAGNNDGAG